LIDESSYFLNVTSNGFQVGKIPDLSFDSVTGTTYYLANLPSGMAMILTSPITLLKQHTTNFTMGCGKVMLKVFRGGA
jgi:hypothetical protein